MRDLVALLGAKKSGAGWMATCPAHDDQRASLSLSKGDDGRWLVNCHAKCTLDDVLDKLGLTKSDLFPTPRTNGNGRRPTLGPIVATYDYQNELGKPLYQVCRYAEPEKTFRQRRPDGRGGWIWKLDDVRHVLFGLPLLKGQRVVYVPEGERDVLTLRAIGLPATTNARGADEWRDEYVEQLIAAGVEKVVVLPDNDPPGRQHAEVVARSCHAAGIMVKVVALPGLPEKADVSDWLQAGHTKAELSDLVKAAAVYLPDRATPEAAFTLPLMTPQEIAGMTEVHPVLFAPYIMQGAITELDAYAKRGKTSFVLYEIGCIVFGVDCLGQPTRTTGVVFLTEERVPTLRRALARSGLLEAPRLHIVSRWSLPASLSWPAIVEAAVAACTRTNSEILVVDTLPQWAGLRGDMENNSGDALESLEPLQRAAAGGLAVLITRHDRKGGGAVGESGRGSSAFAGAVDTIVSLRKPEGRSHPNQRVLEAVSRFDEIPEAVVIERTMLDSFPHVPMGSRFDKNLYRALGDPTQLAADKAEAAILATLPATEAGAGLTVDLLKAGLPDLAPATLTRALESLRARGRISRTGAGKKGDPHVYVLTCPDSYQTSIPRGRDDKHSEGGADGRHY